MLWAAVLPAPIARMTVAAPVTMSPPAKMPRREVWPPSSALTQPWRFVSNPSVVETMSGLGEVPTATQSELYNIKINVSGIKDVVRPKFGVVNIMGAKAIDSLNIFKLGTRLLEESIESNRRNYTIFGE